MYILTVFCLSVLAQAATAFHVVISESKVDDPLPALLFHRPIEKWLAPPRLRATKQNESTAIGHHVETQVQCTKIDQVTSECDYNGVCTDAGRCRCDDGYTTHGSTSVGCTYKQKSRYVAFLLSFFLGATFGAGELYLGNIGIAAGQIALFWGSIPVSLIISIIAQHYGDINGTATLFVSRVLVTLGVVIWWLTDWITILSGDQTDGNGVDTFAGF